MFLSFLIFSHSMREQERNSNIKVTSLTTEARTWRERQRHSERERDRDNQRERQRAELGQYSLINKIQKRAVKFYNHLKGSDPKHSITKPSPTEKSPLIKLVLGLKQTP